MDLVDKLLAQMAVVQAAWVPFLIAVAVVGLGIWKALAWRYGGIIERLQADVTYLERALSRPSDTALPPRQKLPTTAPPMGEFAGNRPADSKPPSREFLPASITPSFIARLRRDLTGIQADKLISDYKGKWIRVSGTIFKTGMSEDEAYISLTVGKADTPIEKIRNQVTLYFKDQIELIEELADGETVSAQGRIEDIGLFGMIVVDSEILEPRQS